MTIVQQEINNVAESAAHDSEGISADYLKIDLKTIFLGGIFIILFIAANYIGRNVVMPVVMAFILSLVFQPVMRILRKTGLPQTIASGLILIVLVAGIIGIGSTLSGPAAVWAEKFQDSWPRLQDRLSTISHPLKQAQKIIAHAEDLTKEPGAKVMPVAVQGTRFFDKVIMEIESFAGKLMTTLIMLFFLMISGDTFLRRLVESLPRFKDKRQVVDISLTIEQDISHYLFTISLMNAVMGILTGIVAAATKLGDPLLWGTLAFVLNFIPIAGPLFNTAILAVAGLVSDIDGTALLPATLYFILHILEGSFITPLLVAKRFTLNPVLIIMSLVFWYYMWGIPGAILSMPILAVIKIICDRIDPLKAFGHFLEG